MKKVLPVLLILMWFQSVAQKTIRLKSPDGNIVFLFQIVNGQAMYNVAYKGKMVIEQSPVSLRFSDGLFGGNLKMSKPILRDSTEEYELIAGKTKHVKDRYKEVLLPLQQTVNSTRNINLVVRVFNDGVAFRYEFPAGNNLTSLSLMDENTGFKIAGNPTIHALFLPNYHTSHEGLYTSISLDQVKEDTLMDMPALLSFSNGIHLAITEAALLDYAGMYLSKHNGVLTSKLSPLPKQDSIKVKINLPHHSPWRVMLISDRVGTLIESNMITSLNAPVKIEDRTWIKQGKTTWHWWNGNVTPDTSFSPGNNFEFHKYYIDFCAKNGIEYHSVIEYGNKEWYENDSENLEPGPNVDVTRPVRSLDMKKVCDYAKTKGVGIRVWVHWGALYPQPRLDSAFAVFERWGVQGMMVDFMDRDDQEMVNMQTEILKKAAKHRLHIQFHGAYKPTGLARTYPNELTREGTLNYEANKWTPGGITPDHDIYMPFTRGLAGPADYHLGGFRAVTPSNFKVHFIRPFVLGTRCHMLAMYVVLESYLGLVSDFPEAYESQPGFDFIKKVPTVWDETKVLDAKVMEHITIARRRGENWYVGAITNNQAKALTISFNFLQEGEYVAEIYKDAADSYEQPNNLIKETRIITAKDRMTIQLSAGGGYVIELIRK